MKRKTDEKVDISSSNFGRVVLIQKNIMRGYMKTTKGVRITNPKQGKLDSKTRKVFKELAELIFDFNQRRGDCDEEKSV